MDTHILVIIFITLLYVTVVGFTYFANKSEHPKALFLLFMTEMWERFSYYGMRALLMLFMVHQLKYADARANLVYGTYTALVYLMPLFGGMAADRVMGYRKAITLGAILMAIGHFILALPTEWSFFAGMAFLISGNGFFKPNISTMVGKLYPDGDPRKDGAFSIFYMGINVGGGLGALYCGFIGQQGYKYFSFMNEENSWHYGFGLAGIFMVLGLINFLFSQHLLGDIGLAPETKETKPSSFKVNNNHIYLLSLLIIPVVYFLFLNYTLMGFIMFPLALLALMYCILIAEHPSQEIQSKSLIQFGAFYVVFLLLFLLEPITGININPVLFTIKSFPISLFLIFIFGMVIFLCVKMAKFANNNMGVGSKQITAVILVVLSVLFWAFYEQGGGSLNLFADRNVNLHGMSAAEVNNNINSTIIVLISGLFAAMWIWLAKRGKEPSTGMKFSLAFFQLGLGFLVFVIGGYFAGVTAKTSLTSFVLGYFLLTTGELCLSPIGLSMITKLAPPKHIGMMMGFWFLASALGQHLAGVIGTLMAIPTEDGATTVSAVESLSIYSSVFMKIFYVSIIGGLILLILVPILKKWSGSTQVELKG